jgi:hypothetical protein
MRWLSKSDTRVLGAILAVVILWGSIPFTAGVTIVAGPTQPTFTVNICQPMQPAVGVSSNPLARPAVTPPQLLLLEHGTISIGRQKSVADLRIAPESPPPEAQS